MIEYLRSDNSPLDIYYTASSYAVNLYFEIYDLDTEEFIQGGKGVASGSSVFTITLNTDSTAYDRKLKIEYVTTTASGAFNEIQYVSLLRPYSSVNRIRELSGLNNSISDNQIKNWERRARLTINSMLGFNFYKEKRSVTVYGNNTDVLNLPDRIYRIDSVYEDDILVYERDNSTYQLDYPLEISTSSNRIKILNSSIESTEILEFPKFSVFGSYGTFKKDFAYKIDGVWGWDYIPSEIEEATSMLVGDYSCNDFNIRNKNISEMSNDSYDIKYGPDSATGTGNLVVDSLLSTYKIPRYMVI